MADDLEQTLETIARLAPELAKHCASVTVGEVVVVLHPSAPPEIKVEQKSDAAPISPLDDHATYGLPPGSKLPGFIDPRKAKQ